MLLQWWYMGFWGGVVSIIQFEMDTRKREIKSVHLKQRYNFDGRTGFMSEHKPEKPNVETNYFFFCWWPFLNFNHTQVCFPYGCQLENIHLIWIRSSVGSSILWRWWFSFSSGLKTLSSFLSTIYSLSPKINSILVFQFHSVRKMFPNAHFFFCPGFIWFRFVRFRAMNYYDIYAFGISYLNVYLLWSNLCIH